VVGVGEQSGRASSTVGRVIADRYELVAPLGTGGMAQVWEANDRLLSRRVAVKLLHRHLADDPAFVQRFRREAVAAARLVHPNIVAVYDTVSTDECEAIVMELVDGETLRSRLDEDGPLSERKVRQLGIELAGALDCAHRNGIVHRDIKPANILITDDGSVRLADFGIAKAEEDPDLTVAGTLVGTAAYLAPEQVGGGRIDQRSDLYALSTVLYEAVSGSIPFRGDSPAATALARLHHDPIDLATSMTGLDPAFAAAVMRNLERAPERRFQSALDFGTALVEVGNRRSTSRRAAVAAVRAPATSPEPAPTVDRRPPRRRSVVGRVILTVLVLGPIALAAALAFEPAERTATPTGESGGTPLGVLAVAAATPFDPMGDTGQENNEQAPRAIDRDPATVWSTEGYNDQTFGTKTGVGLILRTDTPARIASLRIEGSTGWKGAVYVTDTDPSAAAGPPESGGIPIDMASSPTEVDLGNATGSYVLIWITDLGPASGRHRVEIAELSLSGRSEAEK
jgi:serine/threonine protein kinase